MEIHLPTEEELNHSYIVGYRKFVNIDIAALLRVAAEALSVPYPSSPIYIPDIQIFAQGASNKLFLVGFHIKGTTSTSNKACEVLARVPWPHTRCERRLKAEIATIRYLQLHRPTIPIPRILGASYTSQNEVGAPYILFERAHGKPVHPELWTRLATISRQAILTEVARIQAEFMQPLPFDEIGSLQCSESSSDYTDSSSFYVDTFASSQNVPPEQFAQPLTSPPKSFHSLLRTLVEKSYADAQAYFSGAPNGSDAVYQACILPRKIQKTIHHVHEAYNNLNVLLNYLNDTCQCGSSNSNASLEQYIKLRGIWHSDFSFFRNVLFEGLPEDDLRDQVEIQMDRIGITAVLDWEDAVVLPLILLARYLEELISACGSFWAAVYPPSYTGGSTHNTSENDYSNETISSDSDDFSSTPILNTDAVLQENERTFFAQEVTRFNSLLSNDYWRLAEVPLKLYAIAMGGWEEWMFRQSWITIAARRVMEGNHPYGITDEEEEQEDSKYS